MKNQKIMYITINLDEVNKNQTMFNQSMNISKEKFKKKEIMNNQRTLQEEKRIKDSQRLS